MKIVVEVERCCGHARCAAIAPEIFVLNDIGYLDTPLIDVASGDEQLAQRGVRACPERCLSLQD